MSKNKQGERSAAREQGDKKLRIPTFALGLSVVVLGLVAYSNSLSGAFILDDHRLIQDGHRNRQELWPLAPFFESNLRPLLFYTLALNYQLGELDATGYHVFNIGVHLLAALTLFGLVRRTLRLTCFAERFVESARWYAFVTAAIWVVHPLQTQGVNYVVQRCESMVSLFLVLCLYGLVRASQSGSPWAWYLLVVGSAWLGMGAKPVMIVAPVLLYLYDRTFLTRSWGGPFKRRWWLYLAIGPAWLWLAHQSMPSISVAVTSHQAAPVSNPKVDDHQTGSVGTNRHSAGSPGPRLERPQRKRIVASPLEYARTQPEVLLHYLRLVVWPNPLCLDYMWPVADTASAVLPALLILALLAISVWALFAHPPIGFIAFSFFVVLAPTSSFLPIYDLAFEHRMYLASAAVIVMLVFGIRRLLEFLVSKTTWPADRLRWLSGLIFGVALIALTAGTMARNGDYESEITIWESVHSVRPNNIRAINNLAQLYLDVGRREEAVAMLKLADQERVGHPQTLGVTGIMLLQDGKPEEAIEVLKAAVRGMPNSVAVHIGLGAGYEQLENLEAAIHHFRRATELEPGNAIAHKNLGQAMVAAGQTAEGIESLRKAVQLKNDFYEAYVNLGAALGQTGDVDAAIENFETAARLPSDDAIALDNLAAAYASAGRYADAVRVAKRALERAQRAADWKLVAELQARIGQYESQLPPAVP
jgi:tetratricopeptide (TPR) repeat protein